MFTVMSICQVVILSTRGFHVANDALDVTIQGPRSDPCPDYLPRPFAPLPFGVAFAAVTDSVAFLVLLAGGAPSILVTSSRLLLDPPLALLDLPGLPGCLFPVINLLNGIVWHLKSVAQPVCDALMLVICSYRTQYMYAAIFLVCSLVLGLILLKFGRWHISVNSL